MVVNKIIYGIKRARENPAAYWASQASGMGLNTRMYTGTHRAPIGEPSVKRLKSTQEKESMAWSARPKGPKRTGKTNITNERGATTRAAAVKRGKKKSGVSRVPKSKRVKVSAAFKAKVSKVIEAKKIHGVVDVTHIGHLEATAENKQTVAYTHSPENMNATGSTRSTPNAWAFSAEYLLSCASVLFNKKPYINHLKNDLTPEMRWFDADQIGSGGAQGADNSEGGSGGQVVVDSNNAVFTVSNAWEKYLIRNNTQRTVSMKIYLCALKRIGAHVLDNRLGGVLSTSTDGIYDPARTWDNALEAEFLLGRNLKNIGYDYIGECPTEHSQFNKEYKTEVTSVVLEPGQTFDYFIQGPKNLEINYMNNFKNSLHMFFQKHMRYPMFVYHADMVGGHPNAEGAAVNHSVGIRAAMPSPFTTGSCLVVERRRYTKIACPDKAGFRLDTAVSNGSVQFGFHRPAYYKEYFNGFVAKQNGVTRVDEENPVPALGTANVIGV